MRLISALNLLLFPGPWPLPSHLHLSEPTNVELYVDGVNDICTKGGDINFVFTGFSVNGKVWLWNIVVFNGCSVLNTESSLAFFKWASKPTRDP